MATVIECPWEIFGSRQWASQVKIPEEGKMPYLLFNNCGINTHFPWVHTTHPRKENIVEERVVYTGWS